MSYIIDSNIWIYLIAGNDMVVDFMEEVVKSGGETGYSAITRLELFSYPDLTEQEESDLITVTSEFQEVPIHRAIIDEAIKIRKRANIKTPDALIAATARLQDSTLVTRNVSDFTGVKQLEVQNPFEE